MSDLDLPVKGASRPSDFTLDGQIQIETGWLWPNGRVCHSALNVNIRDFRKREHQVFESNFSFDRLVWLCGLAEDERGPTRRVTEDLEAKANSSHTAFEIYYPKSRFELEGYLFAELERGGRPIIHLDSHGSEEGIWLAGDQSHVSWRSICDAVRPINIQSENQTLVVSNCCFSMYAIFAIELTQPTPFQGFIGPVDRYSVGEFEHSTLPFYRALFEGPNINAAIKLLSAHDVWLADQFLLQTLVNYLKQEAVGKGGRKHVEELLSRTKAEGKVLLNEPVTEVRKKLKSLLREKTGPELLDRFVGTFLFGQKPAYTYTDIINFAR